jgi:hypothetical protein
VAVFLLGWLIGGRLQAVDRERVHREAIAESALWLGIRPGLKEAVDRSLLDLQTAALDLDALAKASPPPEGEEGANVRARWASAGATLKKAQRDLVAVQTEYGLTPAQTERLVRRTADMLAAITPGLPRDERARLAQRLEQYLLQDLRDGLSRMPLPNAVAPPEAAKPGEPAPTKDSTPPKEDAKK